MSDPLDATCPRHIREHAYQISDDFAEDLAEREAIMSDGRRFREWREAYSLLCAEYGERPRLPFQAMFLRGELPPW